MNCTGQAGAALPANVVAFPHNREAHSQGAPDVERTNQFDFYSLGKALRDVAAFTGDQMLPATVFMQVYSASRAMGRLLGGELVPISVSRTKAEIVAQHLTTISDSLWDAGSNNFSDIPISEYRWHFLGQAIS